MKTILALLLASTPVIAQTAQPVPTIGVTQFIDSLGVNAHNEYNDGFYVRTGETLFELQYLGIHNVRDGVPTASSGGYFKDALNFLMSNGVHFDLGADCHTNISDYQQQWDILAKAHPGAITAIEGTNEINNLVGGNNPNPCSINGGTNEESAETFQGEVYRAVHSDSALKGVPVYDFTGGTRATSLKGRADFANNHPYPNISRGTTPYARMVSDYSDYYSGVFPRVITEDGYYSQPDGSDGVNEKVQAVGLAQIFFSGAALGIPHTYQYELKDAYFYGSNGYNTYGFFEPSTGTPKQSAVLMHNLTQALNMLTPTAANPAAVSAVISGQTSDSHELAIVDGSNGVSLWTWRDVTPWNVSAQTEAFPADTPIQVTLPSQHGACFTYDPFVGKVLPASPSASGGYTIAEKVYPTALYCSR